MDLSVCRQSYLDSLLFWVITEVDNITNILGLSYNLRYVERNNRKGLGKNPWSVRQTGVYHQYSPQDDAHFWILLHPKNDSKVQIAIQKAARQYSRTNAMLSNAAFMHLLILSSYVDNWRWYMKDLCSDFTKMVSIDRAPNLGCC